MIKTLPEMAGFFVWDRGLGVGPTYYLNSGKENKI